jgi:benzodiazapine receptor
MSAAPPVQPAGSGWISLMLFVLGCELVGISGALGTTTGASAWYRALEMPPFQPPGWLFGPVWTLLYALMGIAVWRIWRHREVPQARRRALVWFAVQLVLNGVWTPVFFGAHQIGLALVILVALLFALVGTILSFRRVDVLASRLLWPYLAWVGFATLLNASIFALN